MSDLKLYEVNPGHTFEGAADPTQSEAGAQVDDVYLNTTSGEEFRCRVATFGSQEWDGGNGSVVPSAILDPSHPDLVAMYTMDNISGSTLVNENGNTSYDGTITGAVAEAGKIGDALSFNNDDDDSSPATDYVPIPNFSDGISELSFCAWVKKDVSSRTSILIGNYNFLSNKRQFSLNFGGSTDAYRLDFIISGTGTGAEVLEWNSGASLTSNTYYFAYCHFIGGSELAISVDGGTLYTTPTSTASLYNTAGEPVVIGAGWPAAADGLKGIGEVDQARFFSRALTQAEITDLYNEGTP